MTGGAPTTLAPLMPLTASVVVATHNRSGRLSRLLDALATQEGVGPFEVIVVDDASTDDTQTTLARCAENRPFRLTALRQEINTGPAAARNRGWRAAQAPLVCFTDDDCVPTTKWLARLVAAFDEADLVQGQTLPNPDQQDNLGPFSRYVSVPSETGYYETCNMAYRRELLERLGGFDERFRHPFGEDIDLAWRAKEAGARSAFSADALVHHDIWPSSIRASWKDRFRRDGLVLAFKKHPGLRERLDKGIFYEPTHAPALAVTASTVMLVANPRSPRRWIASAASVFWYAWNCQFTHPKPRRGRWAWAPVVPVAYILDLTEIAVLARDSLRYRTLQL